MPTWEIGKANCEVRTAGCEIGRASSGRDMASDEFDNAPKRGRTVFIDAELASILDEVVKFRFEDRGSGR